MNSRPGAPSWLYALLGVVAVATLVFFLLPPQKPVRIQANSPLDPNLGVEEPEALSQVIMRKQQDHPVTPEMQTAAQSLKAKAAPDFELKATDGKSYRLSTLWKERPLLIFFVERECPCCLGAKHFVDRMVDLYPKELHAVAIINAEGNVSRAWEKATKPKFLVLEDLKQEAIRAYSAERGVYTTLIGQDGSIVKAYPGYSLEMLQDLSKEIAKLAGVPARKFISAAAPERMTSGCTFPDPKTDPQILQK